jgi:hypothetical protein
MRIAEYIDTCDLSDSLRQWFINNQPEVLELLVSEEARINRQKEKRGKEGLGGVAGLAAQSGLRRRRKRKVGRVSDDQDSSKSTMDTSDPLEKVNYSCMYFNTSFREPIPAFQMYMYKKAVELTYMIL